MSQGPTPGLTHTQTPSGGAAGPTEERIREELARILASHEFRSSKRSQDFLKYVVENTLTGHADMLKERTIGIEVFGRSTSYDPSDDATVRVKAGEVRKRLGLYYSSEGARDPVRVEMPSGTYVPEFRACAVEDGSAELAHATPAPVQAPAPAAEQGLRVSLQLALVALALVMFAVVLWALAGPAATQLDRFWAPILKGASPPMICAAFVPVWGMDRDPNSREPVRLDDYVALNDQFVGGGDLIAASRLTAMLARERRPYRLKVGNDVTFADLRSGSAILVGYSYTKWKEISSQMRYFIEVSPAFTGITDNGKPTAWSLANLPRDRHASEDYAIVSRVFHPDTHAMLVEIAGVTQYGTDAASDLVTNPDLMAEALQNADAGWQTKNMQLVLHVKVIGGAPTAPKVVAKYFW